MKSPSLMGDFDASSGKTRSRKMPLDEIQILFGAHPETDALALRFAQLEDEAVMTSFLKPAQPDGLSVLIAYDEAEEVHVEGSRRREIFDAMNDMAGARNVE